MNEDTNATGNEESQEREDLSQGAESRDAAAESREPESGEDWKRKYLEETKPALEEKNRLKARLAELESGQQSPAADEEEPAGDEGDEAYWAEIEQHARAGNAYAKAQLSERNRRQKFERAVILQTQLNEINDPVERAEVRDHFLKNQRRLGDMKAARAEIRETKLEAENRKLREQIKAMAKGEDPEVVHTETREVSAAEHRVRKYKTEADWDAEQARLKAQGRHKEAMALQVKLRNNELEIGP